MLNHEQEMALDNINEWMNSGESEFILTGMAGTGKSTVIKELVRRENVRNKLFLTATTNKAAKVISGETIHKCLHLKYSPYSKGLVKKFNQVAKQGVYIVDEASMIDHKLYVFIEEEKERGNRFIYVGDKYQLPPVNSNFSIFNRGIESIELQQVMRHESDILEQAVNIRNDIIAGRTPTIKESENVIFLNKTEMLDKLHNSFIYENEDNIKCLAYTNNIVDKFNEYIREGLLVYNSLMGKPMDVSFPSVGEIIVFNKPTKDIPVETTGVVFKVRKDYMKENGINFDIISFHHDGQSSVAYIPSNKDKYKEYYNSMDWKEKIRLDEEIADIKPAYAQTVHKSQGSTYENVFIDLVDISNAKKDYSKLLYVALTRARDKVYVYA